MTNFRAVYINTQATTVVAPGEAILLAVNVNTGVGLAVATVWEGTTGATPSRKIATIDASSKSCNVYALQSNTGWCIVTTGANPDITVSVG